VGKKRAETFQGGHLPKRSQEEMTSQLGGATPEGANHPDLGLGVFKFWGEGAGRGGT